MHYLKINYITRKLVDRYKGFTTILIDSEIESYCTKILQDTLKIKQTNSSDYIVIGVQQELVLQCFRHLLCTNDTFTLEDIIFYIDAKEVKFSEEHKWKVITNDVWCESHYSNYAMSICLSNE